MKLFTAYSKAINAQEKRMGSLFMRPFKRRIIDSESYYSEVMRYIHHNPVKHGLMNDFANYPWSSYNALISMNSSFLNREYVFNWFGNVDNFVDFHCKEPNDLASKIALEV
ncbi:MAG: transposase, partial [Bacteroidia bacterium]